MSDQEQETNESLDFWAVVELFGHQKIAGKVSDFVLGGESFVRVDVPATERGETFTRMFGKGAIYAINPTTEEIATRAAESVGQRPLNLYEASPQRENPALPTPEDFDPYGLDPDEEEEML